MRSCSLQGCKSIRHCIVAELNRGIEYDTTAGEAAAAKRLEQPQQPPAGRKTCLQVCIFDRLACQKCFCVCHTDMDNKRRIAYWREQLAVCWGKALNHNTRAFSAKNVDKERSQDNVEFCHTDIKEVYHQLFDEALESYNEKQKRSERRIDNYYEKIRRRKQEKLFHEVVFQIGNKDDTNIKSSEGQIAKKILSEFMEQFQKRNPNLHVFSSHLHMDEETPHMHIDFVPFISNSKRGLEGYH